MFADDWEGAVEPGSGFLLKRMDFLAELGQNRKIGR